MEKIAGAAIFVVGLLIILLGRVQVGTAHPPSTGTWRLRVWMDVAIQWGSGMLSLWFGVQLFFGHSHFF